MESKINDIASQQDYAFRLMNELAIIFHAQEDFETAMKFYKKALLCMKKRYKNKFQEQPETSKILLNMATLFEAVSNFTEALKHY